MLSDQGKAKSLEMQTTKQMNFANIPSSLYVIQATPTNKQNKQTNK